jgi:aspartate/methionine/tyrosine aminotransferase
MTLPLTRLERMAIDTEHNLADGHARLTVESPSRLVVRNMLSDAWSYSTDKTQSAVEVEFENSFVSAIGPGPWNVRPPPVYTTSASAAIDIVGKLLLTSGRIRVGLIEPTFDNLALILCRLGISLIPLREDLGSILRQVDHDELDAVFLVLPNNPSGWSLNESEILELDKACSRAGLPIIIDQSFRAFEDPNLDGIHLDDRSSTFIVIEDTGKTWPSGELKVGTLLTNSDSTRHQLETLVEEITLNVAPFTFAFITELIKYEQITGRRSRDAVRSNLQWLQDQALLQTSQARYPMSVLVIPTLIGGHEKAAQLLLHDTSVLPIGQFYWSQETNPRAIRIALYRHEDAFQSTVERISHLLFECRDSRPPLTGVGT